MWHLANFERTVVVRKLRAVFFRVPYLACRVYVVGIRTNNRFPIAIVVRYNGNVVIAIFRVGFNVSNGVALSRAGGKVFNRYVVC